MRESEAREENKMINFKQLLKYRAKILKVHYSLIVILLILLEAIMLVPKFIYHFGKAHRNDVSVFSYVNKYVVITIVEPSWYDENENLRII